MVGVAMSEPKQPRWAKPVSSRAIATTLGAPTGGLASTGLTGVASATVRPRRRSGLTGCRPEIERTNVTVGGFASAQAMWPGRRRSGPAERLPLAVGFGGHLQPALGGVLDEGHHVGPSEEPMLDSRHRDLGVANPA